MLVHQFTEDEMTRIYVMREKAAHITKAARSATIANILAPLLCIPMFQEDVGSADFSIWLGYTLLAVAVRTVMVFSLEHEAGKIEDPQRNLRVMTYALGLVGLGWGSGWILMAPDLDMVNRMIYVYMTTAAMIGGMLPLALAFGAGSEQQSPMAHAVIGGIIIGSVLLVPALRKWVEGNRGMGM